MRSDTVTAQGWVDIHQDGIDLRLECGLCGWTLRGLATRADAQREADEHDAACPEVDST
jgi:hypothetical protein